MGLLAPSVVQRINDPGTDRLVVGLSGGVDSMVLLHLVRACAPDKPLLAVHVNHGLQPSAADFEEFCRLACASAAVELLVRRVQVRTGGSQETNARSARYDVFESLLEARDLLLLAHHADDQAETILFRLIRGSRLAGLEGIPLERPLGMGRLFRPLLDVSRDRILAYAREQQIQWIEDPSNAAFHADRNFIRHQVLPLLESRWPAARQRLVEGMERDERVRRRNQQQLLDLLSGIRPSPDCLEKVALAAFEPAQMADMIDAWLLDLDLPLPSSGLLSEIVRRLQAGQTVDVVTPQLQLREHRDLLYALKPASPIQLESCQLSPQGLAGFGSQLTDRTVEGQGLRKGPVYTLRYRQGGETLRLTHRRSLKYLFQAYRVPAWVRPLVPLVFSEQKLVAVVGVPDWDFPMLIADGWRADGLQQGHLLEVSLGDRYHAGSGRQSPSAAP